MQLPRLSLDRTVSSSKSFKNSQSLNIVGECATLDNLPDITVKKKVDSYSKVKMNGNTSVLGLVKVKLRRAYKILLEKFLKYDLDGTQYINKEYFIEIIKSLNTDIELKYLPSLLSECDINVNRTTIPYTKFLMQFMDRSLGSITHRTLTSQKLKTGMVKLEYEIVSYLQCEFLKLLALFQKYDTLSRGIISVEDCKHCLEVFIGLTIQKNEMDCLLVRLPTSMDGADIHYIDFMKELNFNELRNSSKISNLSISTKMRTQEQLILIIRKNITNNLPLIEKYFEEIDIANTKRLTQDYMYLIFKKLPIKPTIMRGEIRILWDNFIKQKDCTINFNEFIRYFTKKENSYPNAKLKPPTMGDVDFLKTSNTMNNDKEMVFTNLRNKIELNKNSIKKEFKLIDTKKTGYIEKSKFSFVLQELNICLNDHELELICSKFKTTNSKINYVQFLNLFTNKCIDNAKNANLLCHKIDFDECNFKKKMCQNQKLLIRTCKKLDNKGEMVLPIKEFKSILELINIIISDEQLYKITSKYDKNLSGKLPYLKLIKEYTKV